MVVTPSRLIRMAKLSPFLQW
ncbi:Protein of unknown function [Bacillus wiedmannii]|nr:Protein of unknown function [Bacillus wiedmannii]